VSPRRTTPAEPSAAKGEEAPLKRSYHVEALAKGLRLLALFSERRPAMKLSDMAAEADVPLPTAFRIWPRSWPRDTWAFAGSAGPHAIRALDGLRPAMAVIRAQGWAVQDEEPAYGLGSVAAPVRDAADRTVAAVNIAVPAREYPAMRMLDKSRPRLLDTCSEDSQSLGGS
jgi:DNA-binding IclR family transcriptional regulator